VPALDPLYCATLSPTILDMLRKEASFHGIIISDSLAMAGVTDNYATLGQVAIQAFNAGCDILLLGGRQLIDSAKTELSYTDIAAIHQALVDAVRSGRISHQRLDAAVAKILALKKKHPLDNSTYLPDYRAHQKLSCTVAERALKILSSSPQNLPNNVFETLQHQLHHLTEVYHENHT
jgi:beta-N-acetylhexosaminidase